MSEGGATTPSHPNMLRNILTGVITTVVGASAVYYLGFSKHGAGSSSGGYLEEKEATTKAWRTYVAVENLEYKNTLLLSNHLKDMNGLDEFKEQLTKESNKFSSDVESLLKTKDVDEAFTALLKRRLDAEKEAMQKWNSFFASCNNIINTTQPGKERNDRVIVEYNKMLNSGNYLIERTKTEITDLSKSLSEKYGQQFAINELLLFQEKKQENVNGNNNNVNQGNNDNSTVVNTNTNNPSDNAVTNYNNNNVNTNYTNTNNNQLKGVSFAGEWDTPGAVITLSSNGRMTWESDNGQNVSGTWQFYNNQLYMTYPVNGITNTYSFNLFNVTANSFTMVLTTSPYYRYDLTRYNDNY